MTTRRQFLTSTALGAAALAAFPRAASAQGTGTAGASAAGPRQGLVDLHSHWFSPRAVTLLSNRSSGPRFVTNEKGERFLERGGGAAPSPGGRQFPLGAQWFDIDVRLKHLAEQGVSHQLISWPTTLNVDANITAADARELWGAYNDDLGGLLKAHRDKLSAVAALATADIDWSARELARGHEELGLIGAVLPNNAFATLEGAKRFAPIFEVAQKYKSHIYLHTGYGNAAIPGQPPYPSHADSASARGALDNVWNFTASTITFAFSGFLDAYPDVTVQIAQLGGAGGIALVAEQLEQSPDHGGDIAARFKRIYLDTGAGGRGPEGIALATRVFGADRIVFGTDYAPQASVAPVIHNIDVSPLTAEDRTKILRETGRSLLKLKGVSVA